MTSRKAATTDVYGKLCYYLHTVFQSFLVCISCRLSVSFRLLQMDALGVPDYLRWRHVGIYRTLEFAVKLLSTRHATLITPNLWR